MAEQQQLDQQHALMPPLTQTVNIKPNDERLMHSGYLFKHLSADRASFDRKYTPRIASGEYGEAHIQNPGMTLRWRTNAQRVSVRLHYTTLCETMCPGKPDCEFKFACNCQCAVVIRIDGTIARNPVREMLPQWQGTVEVEALAHASSAEQREFELELPWCASIDILGLVLQSEASHPRPYLGHSTHAGEQRPRWVALGDSVTHGWCGNESYPSILARWNGWEPLNMGIQGLAISSEDPTAMGSAVAAQFPDLVSIMLGLNDCGAHVDLGPLVRDLLASLRHGASKTPVAVVTPTWHAGCSIEEQRAQIREVVRRWRAEDARVVLVEGRALIQADAMIPLPGNVHPSVEGMMELARNLNAELGFASVRYTRNGCTGGRHQGSLVLEGLTALGEALVFWQRRSLGDDERMASVLPAQFRHLLAGRCEGRTLMIDLAKLASQDVDRVVADSQGQASLEMDRTTCGDAAWQVIDLSSCRTSRRGSSEHHDSTVDSLASIFGPQKPPRPPLPPPNPKPTPPPPAPGPPSPPSTRTQPPPLSPVKTSPQSHEQQPGENSPSTDGLAPAQQPPPKPRPVPSLHSSSGSAATPLLPGCDTDCQLALIGVACGVLILVGSLVLVVARWHRQWLGKKRRRAQGSYTPVAQRGGGTCAPARVVKVVRKSSVALDD